MLLSILAEDTYMVNGKTWKVGDVIPIEGIMTGVAGRAMTVAELNDELVGIRGALAEIRANLLTRLAETSDVFDEKAAELAWSYEETQRDWLYYSDCLYRAIQKHYGGQLPINRDPVTGAMKIRKHQPGEALNYLRDICGNTVQWPKYDGIVRIARKLRPAGSETAKIWFHEDAANKSSYPYVMAAAEMSAESQVADRLCAAMTDQFGDLRRYGYPMLLLWKLDDASCLLFEVSTSLGQQQRQGPKESYNQAIRRIVATMKTANKEPSMLAFAMVGTYEHEKGEGRKPSLAIITGEVSKEYERHSVALVSDTEIDVVSRGEGLKTDEDVAKAFRAAVGREVKS